MLVDESIFKLDQHSVKLQLYIVRTFGLLSWAGHVARTKDNRRGLKF